LTGLLGTAAPLAGSSRYIQFTIQMNANTAGKPPIVSDVSISYQKQ
jgi:hypothetical protein